MYGCAFDKMKLFYLVLTDALPFFCNEKWKGRQNSQNGIMGKNLSKLIQKSITRKECNPIKMSIELSQEQIMSQRVEISICNRLAISFRPNMSDFSHEHTQTHGKGNK